MANLVAGRLLMGIAAFHLILALGGSLELWSGILSDGLWNTGNPPWVRVDLDRQLIFWVSVGSFAVPLYLLGWVVSWAASQGVRPPHFLGWGLLGYTLLAGGLAPVSGFWLLLVPAGLLLRPDRTTTKTKESV